jgi:hypothetical protein
VPVSRPRLNVFHLRQTGLSPQVRSPKIGRNLESFTPLYKISLGRLKPEPEDGAPVGYGLPQPPVGPRQSAKG